MCLPPPSFREAGAAVGGTRRPSPAPTETVKRADLFGNITDTHRTEAELNGFRPTQGKML